jgi:CRP/FNR family transcriptional regulator, cyclic AMP receptor protein
MNCRSAKNYCRLINDVSIKEQNALFGFCRVQQVMAEQFLLQPSRSNHFLYIVESGAFKVLCNDGLQCFALDIVGPGAVLGEISVLTGQPPTALVRAKGNSRVWAIEREDFLECLRNTPQLSFNLMRIQAERERRSTERLMAFRSLGATARLARQLVLFATRYADANAPQAPVEIPLHLNHQDIGELIGLSRENTCREMGKLRRLGFVQEDTQQHRITVCNVPALRRLWGVRGSLEG